ncbi:unnamed protein product, partial [Ectocarpus fasciculatus]
MLLSRARSSAPVQQFQRSCTEYLTIEAEGVERSVVKSRTRAHAVGSGPTATCGCIDDGDSDFYQLKTKLAEHPICHVVRMYLLARTLLILHKHAVLPVTNIHR